MVHIAVHDRVLPCGHIDDRQELDTIEMGPTFLPVIGIAGELRMDARLVVVNHVSARPNRAVRVRDFAAVRRHDHQMVVGNDEAEVGIAALELDDDLT